MNLRSLTNHLEDCLALEIESKRAALAWIEQLERTLGGYDAEGFEGSVEAGAGLPGTDERNAKRRKKLIGDLAAAWGVPEGTLTLGSIARRLGPDGERLDALREELRDLVAGVLQRRRRLSSLIGLHRRVNTELMQLILGCESEEQVHEGGSLVNAEA